MKIFSFRTILAITIFLVVGFISFFMLYFFNIQMSKEMYRHTKVDVQLVLSMLQGHYIHATNDTGYVQHPVFEDFHSSSHLRNTYLINYNDSIIISPVNDSTYANQHDVLKISDLDRDIVLYEFTDDEDPYLRAYIRLQNSPECYSCHPPARKYLGMMVFDVMLSETNQNIAFVRNFSTMYSVLLVFIILASAFAVHYRFVKKSLFNFNKSINKINQGNLDERISIPNSRELSELGENFNKMVNTFQNTQQELQLYHEKELKDKSKMATIGEMAARLAHEIRNPLTGIANAIEILVDQMPDNESKPVLEEVHRQAERVNNAITNILQFSRNSNMNLEKRDINEIINALVFFVKNQMRLKKVEFKLNLQPNIPQFEFDHEQIENVLLNLVSNAINAIKDEGTITFTTSFDLDRKTVNIIIADTGEGIPSKIINDVFKPFYTTRTEGTGLGLAISKEIVEKHNGKIWLESIELKGTKFFITLPVK